MTDKPRIVVTRRIPDEALELVGEASEMWLSPHDRPLTEAELHEAIAGADAVVTMLHDRVDAPFLDAAGRAAAMRGQRRRRLRQHRRRRRAASAA